MLCISVNVFKNDRLTVISESESKSLSRETLKGSRLKVKQSRDGGVKVNR